jgi:ABC-type amino acid transport system permease subunit
MSLRDFGPNELMFLLLATRWTILLALIAFAGGGLIGIVVAATRVAGAPAALAGRRLHPVLHGHADPDPAVHGLLRLILPRLPA